MEIYESTRELRIAVRNTNVHLHKVPRDIYVRTSRSHTIDFVSNELNNEKRKY